MRIACIGGGPGGLYFAILLKKRRPGADITVFERNAPGETFGWGVVFSDETLSYLEENDPESAREITAQFAHWDAIDIFYKGELTRSGGHGFSGIARRELLRILEERCVALGVTIRYRTEVDPAALRTEYDLVVAADGVNSKTRALYADAFKPSVDTRKSKYIWLGTHRVFDAFTFVYRENEHGVFQAHAYRFDKDTSTFIVETDPETWAKAGFAHMPEAQQLAYLEHLFAPELHSEKLLPNRSTWLNFLTLKCARWSEGNVVLIGDAAHTAHFSIGSGTKLAMEDAIALAKFVDEAPSPKHVPDALRAYEEDRRLIVEKTQGAALDSLTFFENTKRYMHFDPLAFSFRLLTRSKKIGYENLKLRDEGYVQNVNRSFDARTGPTPPPMFVPYRLRGMQLENRMVVSPMCMYCATNGTPDDFHLVHLGSRAMGGAGLVFTEMTNVAEEGRISLGCTGMYAPEHVTAWRRITDFVHSQSRAKIALQLGHAGRKGSTKKMWEGSDVPLDAGNWPLMSASPIAYAPKNQVPREMNREDMDRVKAQFVASTKMAIDADFDMLEVHMAHGYLLASFLSPLTNVRQDAYGGSPEARLRYPLEVFDAVRAVWPSDKPMSVRISATDWYDGGLTGDDAVIVARALYEHGCDIIDVSSGQTLPEGRPVFYGRMYQAPFSDQIRNELKKPTMTVGNITSADQANTLLAAGRADLVVLARGHLRDPYFTYHAAEEAGFTGLYWPPQYGTVRPLSRPGP